MPPSMAVFYHMRRCPSIPFSRFIYILYAYRLKTAYVFFRHQASGRRHQITNVADGTLYLKISQVFICDFLVSELMPDALKLSFPRLSGQS